LILKADELPLSCVFVEANPGLPDSRAAGEAVKVLDAYLGLKVDYKPLVKTAEEFETKLKDLIMKAKKVTSMKEQKEAGYLG
jgi:predicted ATP-grasp superfamily ATP-dependent carboligase